MGKPYEYQRSQLIRNRKFFNWDYWDGHAGWALGLGNYIEYDQDPACNQCLWQNVPDVADGVYFCQLEAVQIGFLRTVRFQVGNVWKDIVPDGTLRTYYFGLNPQIIGNFSISVSAAAAIPHSLRIYAVSVIGEMDGDPMYDMLYENSLCPAGLARTEFTDLGGGEEVYRIAGRQDASNCLIKVE